MAEPGYYDPNQDPYYGQPPAPGTPPSAAQSVDWNAVQAFLHAYGQPSNPDVFPSAVKAMIAAGLLPQGTQSDTSGDIHLPTGEKWRAIADGGQAWTGQNAAAPPPPIGGTGSTGGSGSSGAGGGGGGNEWDSEFAIDPSYLTPFQGRPPSMGRIPDFMAPGPFQAPTKDTLLGDPSYLWREGRLRGAIENSAAARGTLNSGGTLDDIMSNVGSFAGQEYQAAWDRAFGLWNSDWNNALTSFRTGKDVNDTMYSRAWNQYLDEQNLHFRQQNEPFSKLATMARLGVDANR